MDKQGSEAVKAPPTTAVVDKKLPKESMKLSSKSVVLIIFAVVLVGGVTGYVAAFAQSSFGPVRVMQAGKEGATTMNKGDIIGSDDTETYKDAAEGKLVEGGFEGEGAYHLERPGGESQSVYLTSSVVDLTQFIGKNIKVWGQTNTAQKVGWLMDVGRVQLLE